jgi:alkanesulfonate monooxygenase SsuD/methylene tetrahydromethanopterin reductase-like flavin-dependent oxidoreductase (luciferase family)
MVGVPVVAAESDIEAERLATSMYLRTLGILRGQRAGLQPPVESMEGLWTRGEQLAVAERMALMVAGGRERVRDGLQQILDATQADELILVSETWDRAARLRSFEIIAEVAGNSAT